MKAPWSLAPSTRYSTNHQKKSITNSMRRPENNPLQREDKGPGHKVLTYIEYRAVSGVFRTIGPPPNLLLASVSSPAPKAVHSRRAVRGWGGVNISEDARHWIGLLQYNPSTVPGLQHCSYFYTLQGERGEG